MAILTIAGTILKVVLGISFVIFWHELGHFLLAKWNGVHVKTFSIGFPPTMARLFKYKETDYVIGWIPLGGYVRMLGDEEGEAKDVESPSATDPAAYHNKSVWARMAIISAGVILNVFLGLVCFTAAYKMGGLEQRPALIGYVGAGGPAYVAGLRPGDDIVSIDGRKDVTYEDLFQEVTHSLDDQIIRLAVRREGSEEPIDIPIEPRRDPIVKIPTIRVEPANGLKLGNPPFRKLMGVSGAVPTGLESGAVILRAGPPGGELAPLSSFRQLELALSRHRSGPLEVVLAHEPDAKSGQRSEFHVTLPPVRFVDLGFAPRVGGVTAIRKGSAAEVAGLRIGDRIVSVDGQPVANPFRLPGTLHDAIGQPVRLGVRRDGSEKEVELTVEPAEGLAWSLVAYRDSPLDLDTIGAAIDIEPIIDSVTEGSPASQAGLKPGDVIEKLDITFSPSEDQKDQTPVKAEVEFGPAQTFAAAFERLQGEAASNVSLTIKGRPKTVDLRPEPVDGWYMPRRGLRLTELSERLKPLPLAEATTRGSEQTISTLGSMYRLIQSLFQRRVSAENLMGPVGIAGLAYQIAGRSFAEFIQFIGMLSLNLAVVNFLPIPPLDGGKMVFLLGEAIRGRPLPESWQVGLGNIGVLLVLGLMIFVLFQDVIRLF